MNECDGQLNDVYLVFIARPSFDLFGLWVGLLTGTSSSFLRAIIMILDADGLGAVIQKYKPTQVYHLAALLSATAEKALIRLTNRRKEQSSIHQQTNSY